MLLDGSIPLWALLLAAVGIVPGECRAFYCVCVSVAVSVVLRRSVGRGGMPLCACLAHACVFRAGELTPEEVERVVSIIQNPRQFKIPDFYLNRQKDITTGQFSQKVSNQWDAMLREDITRMKKIRLHRGIRHHYGIRVRGQHTKTSGRHRHSR